MTSSSQSNDRGSRNLAVYQTPSIPEGWHGRDLVRIVDPVGLAAAWLSPVHAGAVASFEARSSADTAWVSLLRATPEANSAVGFVVNQNESTGPLWSVIPGWSLLRRDPTSVTIASSDGAIEVRGICEAGELRLFVLSKCRLIGSIDFDFSESLCEQPVLESKSIRTSDSLEIRLFLNGGSAESD